MWCHLLQRGDFAFVPEPLCKFRWHAGSETSRNVESLGFVPEFRTIVGEYAGGEKGDGLLLRHRWKMQVAFDVWTKQLGGLRVVEAHRAIRKIYPLALFYLFLPVKVVVAGSAMVKGKLAALRLWRTRRRAPA